MNNFLANLTYQTEVGGSLSALADLISGVVHGSGFGLILCLIYILHRRVSVKDQLAKALKQRGVVTAKFLHMTQKCIWKLDVLVIVSNCKVVSI